MKYLPEFDVDSSFMLENYLVSLKTCSVLLHNLGQKTHGFVYIFSCLFTNQLLRLTAAESYSKNSRSTDDMLNNFWSWFEKRWRHCYNYDWLRDPNLFGNYCYWLSYRIEMFIYGFRDQLSLTNKVLLSQIDSVRVILVKINFIIGKAS